VAWAAVAMLRGDAHPAAASAAAAHPSVPVQVSLDVSQVRRGRAAGDVHAALAFSDHEAAPAERVRHVRDAAAARSRCRTAADDVSLTSGSDTSGSEDSASESDGPAGAGLHAGGQPGLLPAVLPCCKECCWPLGRMHWRARAATLRWVTP